MERAVRGRSGDFCGIRFGPALCGDAGGSEITHNLRTVVFDAQGRMKKVFSENAWTPVDLADELRAATMLAK
jgi:hypothetical protein